MRKNQVGGLNKRASERVPRKPAALNGNQMSKEHIIGPAPNKDLDFDNPRNFLNKPLSNKPYDGDPKVN